MSDTQPRTATSPYLPRVDPSSSRAADWIAFGRWCQERGHPALPAHPGAVAIYLSALADRHLAPSTVGRLLAAIGHHHRLAGVVAPHKAEDGTVTADVLAGIRRSQVTPPRRKAAADSYVVHAVLRAIEGDTLADVRDRALVSFGLATALRRSELVAFTVAGLERVPDGLRVRVVRSKTDQEGKGAVIAVPDGCRLNLVRHLDAWLVRAGIGEGPMFRSLVNGLLGSALTDQSVSLIVKRRAFSVTGSKNSGAMMVARVAAARRRRCARPAARRGSGTSANR